ncbi:MAG: DUF5067 domain-containing protein [Clostridia bacterium]|nr:DUF5067 domain-containing protein [Clostridia bacterium]
MKKLVSIVLSVVLVFAFAGCSGSKVTNEAGEAVSEFALNETADFDGLKITAVNMEETKGKDYFTAGEGNVFVGVEFLIENTTEEEVNMSSLLMFEAYADDMSCDYSITGTSAFGGETVDGAVASGKKLQGWYAIEVPEDWKTIEMKVSPDIMDDKSATFVFNK